MHGPFPELDGEKIEVDVNLWSKLIVKLQRTFKALPAPLSALNEMRKKVSSTVQLEFHPGFLEFMLENSHGIQMQDLP